MEEVDLQETIYQSPSEEDLAKGLIVTEKNVQPILYVMLDKGSGRSG